MSSGHREGERNRNPTGGLYKCLAGTYDCDYQTDRHTDLRRHYDAKHSSSQEKMFQCPSKTCKKGFKRKDHLRDHCKRVHDRDLPREMGGTGQRISSRSGSTQGGSGQSGTGQRLSSQSGSAQVGSAQSGSAQSSSAQSSSAQSYSAQSGSGQSSSAQSSSAQSYSAQSGSGQTLGSATFPNNQQTTIGGERSYNDAPGGPSSSSTVDYNSPFATTSLLHALPGDISLVEPFNPNISNPSEPQCWERGCEKLAFKSYSSLRRHERDRHGHY